jgi:hypothetical protein
VRQLTERVVLTIDSRSSRHFMDAILLLTFCAPRSYDSRIRPRCAAQMFSWRPCSAQRTERYRMLYIEQGTTILSFSLVAPPYSRDSFISVWPSLGTTPKLGRQSLALSQEELKQPEMSCNHQPSPTVRHLGIHKYIIF